MIPKIGAGIVSAAIFLFAICLLTGFNFGAYLVCMFLPVGYIMMAAGFYHESGEERKVAAIVGVVFSAIYAVLIFLVYFAQLTNVRLDDMTEQAVIHERYLPAPLFRGWRAHASGLSSSRMRLTISMAPTAQS